MTVTQNRVLMGIISLFLLFFLFYTSGEAQVIRGTVADEDSNALGEVSVSIPSDGLVTHTSMNGGFTLEVNGAGRYTIEFARIGYNRISLDVAVEAGEIVVNVVMVVDPISLPSVTITAKPRPSSIEETALSVSVIEGREMKRLRGQSIIAAIERLPGVAAVSSSMMSLKPIIRGLGFQRVVLLENGVRHETQQWDDDDTPAIDALGDQRIEIVRGPGSVLYGSDALGGVINIVPEFAMGNQVDSSRLNGEITLNGFSSNRQIAGNIMVNGLLAPVSYEAQLSMRHAGDVRTPEEVLFNTGAEEINGRACIALSNSFGDLRLAYSHFDQNREILPALEEEDEDEEPRQTTKHSRIFLSYRNMQTPLKWDVAGVYQVNDVAEYEESDADQPRINLRLETFSLDAKAHHGGIAGSLGTIGVDFQVQRNQTLGEEPLIPEYRQYTAAGFLFEEFQRKNFNISTGMRYDIRVLKTGYNEELDVPELEKTFQAFTASLGGVWHLSRTFALTLNGGKGWRAPIAEELFVNGVEEGSLRFKIGNPGLKPEESYSVDFGTRLNLTEIKGNMSVFYNRITRYIHLAPTGIIDSATSAERYEHRQADAALWGSEIDIRYQIVSGVSISAGMDLLWGRNTDTHSWLPLAPPHRFAAGIEYRPQLNSFIRNPRLRLDARFHLDQNRVDLNEEPTPGYTLFDFMAGADLLMGGHLVLFDLMIRNLFDKAYRDHLSLYKEFALNPGIDVSLKISVPFTIVR